MMVKGHDTVSRAEIAARGRGIVEALGGHWAGERGMCRCPAHPDRSPSLSVRVGDHALLFKCFGGCETLDVLSEIRRLDAAALRLRASEPLSAVPDNWARERAKVIWDEGRAIGGTLAQAFLTSRGIATVSPALRFHPSVPLKRLGKLIVRPAMLAAIRDGGGLTALQRTFLDPLRGGLAPDLGRARRILARPGSGAVQLAQAGPALGLAEGIETAMSAMQILRLPVWATLGAERFARISLPPSVEHLVLLPDSDAAGLAAERRALLSYARDGRSIETILPPGGCNDWNDAILCDGMPRRIAIAGDSSASVLIRR